MTEPQHLSPRRPGTKSNGRRVDAVLAGLFGAPLPWQSRFNDVFCEVDPSTGLYTRHLSVLTVQRQTGKTHDVLAGIVVDRCLFSGPSRRVWFTMQTGQYARDQWQAIVLSLTAPGSPLAGHIAVSWSKGGEVATFPNGSTFRPFPPTEDALHSKQSDLVIVDEGWKHAPDKGAALMQAIGPTQATRPGAQILIMGTMGTAASTWFHSYVDAGRRGDAGIDLYVEYGIGDDGDPDDLDEVIARHPGVAGGLTTPEFLISERAAMSRNDFARAYGNARTSSDVRFIDRQLWTDRVTIAAPAGRLALAAAVAEDRSRTAILVVGDGVAEVVESRPGVAWAAGRIQELLSAHSIAGVAVTGFTGSPSAPLHDALVTAGVTVTSPGPADYAAACLRLMDDLGAGLVHYRRHANLDRAADAAVPVPVGDGGWRWGQRRSGGPIPEIEALTVGHWLAGHLPAPKRKPVAVA